MKSRSVAVLVSGNGSNLQALIDAGVEIALVVSNRAGAYALERAAGADINTEIRLLRGDRERYDTDLADFLNDQGIDLVVLAGWMHILGERFLSRFRGQIINLHPALPGAFPGLRGIERSYHAFRAGEVAEVGCMVHRVIAEVDAGEVLDVEKVTISTNDSLETFTAKMHQAEHRLLPRVVRSLTAPNYRSPNTQHPR